MVVLCLFSVFMAVLILIGIRGGIPGGLELSLTFFSRIYISGLNNVRELEEYFEFYISIICIIFGRLIF